MADIQRINATRARNDFFNLLKRSYLKDQSFLVEKSGIPMVYIIPAKNDISTRKGVSEKQKRNLGLWQDLAKFRESMQQTSDSVSLLRRMRRYGR